MKILKTSIGIPGKSNAFAISSKLGLAENIIEDAKGRLSERDVNFEDMLANLEQSRITIEIQKYKAEIEDLKKKLTAKNERLDNSRDEILRKANEEAVQILKEAKDLADETIRNFNKYGQGQAPMSKMEKERSRVRDKMSASEKALSMKKKETVEISIPVTTRGIYHYQIYQTTEPKEAYACDQSRYDVSVEAFYNEADQFKTVTVVKNQKGEKIDQITFLNRLNKTNPSNQTAKSDSKKKVKTGDSGTIWGYVLLLVSSMICFVILFYENQKRRKGEIQDEAE